MRKLGLTFIAAAGLFAIALYALSPEGPLGYDEGVRLVAYTNRAAGKLRNSPDNFAMFTYTPKYGNDQSFSVEFTEGEYCAHSGCKGAIVIVHATKGKSGAGYALARAAAVPHHLLINKAQGPVLIRLRKEGNVIQVVGLQ